MKSNTKNLAKLTSLMGIVFGLMVFALVARAEAPHETDSLYIGDGGDDTVKRFNAKTGAYVDKVPFVSAGSGDLHGPRGLIFTGGKLDVVNQNVNTPFNGEILQYRRDNGAFLGALVPNSNPDAPVVPRGIIRGFLPTVYVADFGDFSQDPVIPGKVVQFDAIKGNFIRNLDTTGFNQDFFPRGIVFGPDGLIYVSVTGNLASDPLSAYILRFNPITGKFMNIVVQYNANAKDCSKDFHRPEGLVFGPDNKLYVTSFRADANDTDKVLIFERKTGKCLDKIDLDQVGGSRAFAQALLFGPEGRSFCSY